MVSIRLQDSKVVGYGEVVDGLNPFPDGTIVECEFSFFDENFETYEINYTDGKLTLGAFIVKLPQKSDKEEISELKQLVADLAALQLGV